MANINDSTIVWNNPDSTDYKRANNMHNRTDQQLRADAGGIEDREKMIRRTRAAIEKGGERGADAYISTWLRSPWNGTIGDILAFTEWGFKNGYIHYAIKLSIVIEFPDGNTDAASELFYTPSQWGDVSTSIIRYLNTTSKQDLENELAQAKQKLIKYTIERVRV